MTFYYSDYYGQPPEPERCRCARFNSNILKYEQCCGIEGTEHTCEFANAPMPQPSVHISKCLICLHRDHTHQRCPESECDCFGGYRVTN